MMGIAYDASEALEGTFFTDRGVADLTCHRKDGRTISLTLCDDAYILTQEGQVFRRLEGMSRLRTLSPHVQALGQRVRCGANLRNLWHHFRLYYIFRHAPTDNEEFWNRYLEHGYAIPPDALKAAEEVYPPANEWCDAIRVRECACPGAGKGRCHYAMNPNCRPDSPGDMVLLFETKAGWNQHGGRGLFTFENHDPRGGCVLRNDGTVKFIRTEHELQQLRWE